MRKRDNFCIIVIIVVSLALLIVDIGRTFAYFGTDDNPITSTFNGVITDSSTADNQEFVSNDDNSVAVTVFGGSPVRNNIMVEKTGNGSSNDGGNAAVVVSGNGNFTVNSGNIISDGLYSDAVYVKSGTFTAWLTSIQTKSHHSNGLVVTNNSNIIANYLNVETLGDDSATINNISGNVIVNGGSYKTNGDRSPLILASGDVTVNQASTFVSEKSEGIIVNGNHSVTFNNSSLTTTNTSLYNDINRSKGILLYQSSNKNNDYVAVFNATKSNVTTNKGDTFYVTNTKATINLTNNTIVNNDGDFLRIESSSYGVSGSNGGDVLLNMSNQSVNGNIVVDDISKLEMNLVNSSFEGSINSSNSSDDVALSLSSDSSITLTRDTYVSSLENGDDTNSNIHLNGHDLYVNGQKLVIGTGVSDNSGGNGSAETGTNGGTSTTGGTGNGSTNGGTSAAGTTSGSTSGTGNSGSATTQSGSSTVSGGTGNGSGTTSGNDGGTTDNKKGSSSSSDKKTDSNSTSSDTSKNDSTKSDSNIVKKKSSGSSVSSDSKEITQKDLDEIDKNISNVGSNSSSIYVVDDKTLLIINLVGILLIATSSIYLIKNRVLKRINEV